VVLPWHNPVLLAEQAATLDLLSNGRFDFGVGRGYRANEFSGFRIPMEEAEERYQECLQFIRKAWTTEGRFSHRGKYWSYDDVIVEPAPTQSPHPPLWIGATSQPSIARAAAQGFNLLLPQNGSPAEIGAGVATYRNGVEARGGVFDPYSVGVTRALHIARTPEEREAAHVLRSKFVNNVRDLARPAGGQPLNFIRDYASLEEQRQATETDALLGSPEEIVERLKTYQAEGVEYVLLMDVGGSREALRIFANEIMPEFAETAPLHARRSANLAKASP
jgi:alkanesulfonate monooxygenase SsuD/methylene tetrahydromethanopterin reductase-like flavin-dependent oxidoreductase (luciferase family)